jgi:hypothetical protein
VPKLKIGGVENLLDLPIYYYKFENCRLHQKAIKTLTGVIGDCGFMAGPKFPQQNRSLFLYFKCEFRPATNSIRRELKSEGSRVECRMLKDGCFKTGFLLIVFKFLATGAV